jgi:transposase
VAGRGDGHRQSTTGRRGNSAASACFIVGTNELESEALSDHELVTTYKDQGGVERGFRFLRRSAVPGLLGRSLETGADYRASV